MARAQCCVTAKNHLCELRVAALAAAGIICLWTWGSAVPPLEAKQVEKSPALAGYVSQEKRFLMYLFNGSAGKAQIA